MSENNHGVPQRSNIPWQETYSEIGNIGYDG